MKNHCHLNHQVMDSVVKAKGGRGGRRGDDRRDNRRGNGRRDDFKKGSRSNDRFDKEKRYRKDNKKPRTTSIEKQTGFVIRNKGQVEARVRACGGPNPLQLKMEGMSCG